MHYNNRARNKNKLNPVEEKVRVQLWYIFNYLSMSIIFIKWEISAWGQSDIGLHIYQAKYNMYYSIH